MIRFGGKTLPRFAAIGMIAALGACQAADGTNQAPDTALINSLLTGLGAVDPDVKPIEYSPRAPLAMPSEPTALPSPETKVAGANSADWPKEPENVELNKLKAIYADDPNADPNEPLAPAQTRGFKIRGVDLSKPRDHDADRREDEIREGSPLTAAELNAAANKRRELEPELSSQIENSLSRRNYLIEPPVAYSTPSPDAPLPQAVEVRGKTRIEPEDAIKQPLTPHCLQNPGSPGCPN